MSQHLGTSNERTLEVDYPLHKACRDGDQEKVTALLLAGQHDLYEEDGYYGWTPTHWASYFGKLACLRKLIGELNSVSACNLSTKGSGETPVHVAALGGQPNCLLWLLQAGGYLETQDYLGDTPIHKAARAGSMECISLLVSQNAALDMKNYNGHTACEVATNSNHIHCGEYLEKALQLQQAGELQSTHQPIQSLNNNNNNTCLQSHNMNGHSMHNGETSPGDCDMDMEISTHENHNNHSIHNGFHGYTKGDDSEMNGESPINGCRGSDSAVFRAFSGMKRSLDDEEDEGIKRRCYRESKCEETSLNNNVLSSYQSILAISTTPVKPDPVITTGHLEAGEENRMQESITTCDNGTQEHSYPPLELHNPRVSSVGCNGPSRCVSLYSHFI
ncbi:ankyrin repeat domain-containing protein 10 isoform X1 [Patella vulgata]|uniref:ankyrin repeat domain-containing protein 10 isoform X1 n=1 Tax=Patella vulgata TaxID=6465 RepID=UPI00217F45D8|nr:ankyrin repeat domain-containing protein 10 isoform X1 [Patella vulgata]